MLRVILTACATLAAANALAAVDPHALEPAHNDVSDVESLQRGAKYFVNYCLGCHSAQYVRYNRLGEDLGLTEAELIENLMFTGERPFDTMANAMQAEDAVRWFGIAPPDVSLIARSRGADYIYNFLRGFYQDESTATGANNLVLPNTAMPHVLWELQGIRRPVTTHEGNSEETTAADTAVHELEMVRPGLLSEAEFDQVVRDIVNFLDYIGEPMQLQREAMGTRVIAFLLVFLLISWLLKKEIWKDVK